MKEEIKQETLDICVTARFRDKEIAMKDLLKALFDENEKLKNRIDSAISYIQSYNIDFNNTEFSECPITIGELENLLKILKGSEE